jgi:PPM family protein phosphatase
MVLLKNILLLVILLIIIVLIKIKLALNKQTNVSAKIQYGNGQIIGTEKFQNDYFTLTTKGEPQKVLAVVADGTTKRKVGKVASVITIDVLRTNFKKGIHAYDSEKFFKASYDETDKMQKENIIDNVIGSNFVVVLIKNIWIEWSSVGSCALFLYRANHLKLINDIHNTKPLFGKIKLEKNDIILLCSKGIYANLWELELEEEIIKKIHPDEKAKNILKRIKNKNLKEQDNATLIIIENIMPNKR